MRRRILPYPDESYSSRSFEDYWAYPDKKGIFQKLSKNYAISFFTFFAVFYFLALLCFTFFDAMHSRYPRVQVVWLQSLLIWMGICIPFWIGIMYLVRKPMVYWMRKEQSGEMKYVGLQAMGWRVVNAVWMFIAALGGIMCVIIVLETVKLILGI